MADDWQPVTYDPATRQLSAVPASFAARPLGVLSIVWRSGIESGANVAPGDELGTIQWEDNSRETFSAPDNCAGQIASVNRDIMFENLEFEPAAPAAKVIVNSRTGTIVIGQDVRLLPAAITHGGITVTINESQDVSQPGQLAAGDTVVTTQSIIDVRQDDSRMFVFDPGITLDTLVRAINEVGAAPGDVMAILEALDQAGALRGELIVI